MMLGPPLNTGGLLLNGSAKKFWRPSGNADQIAKDRFAGVWCAHWSFGPMKYLPHPPRITVRCSFSEYANPRRGPRLNHSCPTFLRSGGTSHWFADQLYARSHRRPMLSVRFGFTIQLS